MDSENIMACLPTELLLLVVDSVVDSSGTYLAYPANDLVTITLFNLALTCRDLRLEATQILYSHCLYIDSEWRLGCLLRTLRDESVNTGAKNSILAKAIANRDLGLFLAPFPKEDLDRPQIVRLIIELFDILAPHLRRLAIDMPLRYMWPEDDYNNIRPSLRRAFEGLSNLEQFSSIQDELFLRLEPAGMPERQPPVWAMCWPKLRRLSLYNQDICSENFLRALWSCPRLEIVVLVRADGIGVTAPDPFLRPESESYIAALPGPSQKLELKFIDTPKENETSLDFLSRLRRTEERDAIDVIRDKVAKRNTLRYSEFPTVVMVPRSYENVYSNEIEMAQEWVKGYVISGRLWDLTESSAK